MSKETFADAADFTRLWVCAQPIVASYISTLVPNLQDAQDLLQKVALTVLEKFSEYDNTRPFTRWALGVARFEVLGYQRQQARGRLLLSESLDNQVADACEALSEELELRRKFMRECLGRVRGRSLALLRLRYDEKVPFAEIARRLRISSGAARVAVARVRASLRQCIERKLRMA